MWFTSGKIVYLELRRCSVTFISIAIVVTFMCNCTCISYNTWTLLLQDIHVVALLHTIIL